MTTLPDDDRTLFTKDEVFTALAAVLPEAEARQAAEEIFAPIEPELPRGASVALAADVLDLLLLVSDDCARRVAAVLLIPEAEALRKRAAVRRRFGLPEAG